ncbi:uncharacterized protein MKK02DRAFT_41062 [Dioszegia hungarica]|uniref:Uncharacterized protein n=1 Tax=Dioszegia hungarica TaxID=4972 RepID=A0AA38H333_9TREE|nr:uncharacterized protein MKK02DRAFT_41062 [Dioszegia hungarica]KAI9632751.1 hypothetical protein MKK02DRAFT_41062 [Dioszegia hungarica]
MFFKIAAPVLLAASALAQTFSVSTPASLPQCLPAQIQITGGTSPYILAAIPAAQPAAPAIAIIATNIASSPYTWTVNLQTGLNITLRVTDSTGALTYSSPIVIQAGSSSSCLNASASTGGLSTVSVSTTITTSGTQSGTVSAAVTTSTTRLSSSSSSMSMTSSMASSSSAGAATSSAASSAAASSSRAWAVPTAVAGIPALAMAAIGGVAVLM